MILTASHHHSTVIKPRYPLPLPGSHLLPPNFATGISICVIIGTNCLWLALIPTDQLSSMRVCLPRFLVLLLQLGRLAPLFAGLTPTDSSMSSVSPPLSVSTSLSLSLSTLLSISFWLLLLSPTSLKPLPPTTSRTTLSVFLLLCYICTARSITLVLGPFRATLPVIFVLATLTTSSTISQASSLGSTVLTSSTILSSVSVVAPTSPPLSCKPN